MNSQNWKQKFATLDTDYVIGVDESYWRTGLNDACASVLKYRLWCFLGWQDIKQRYRRSLLGPFWLTISTGVMIAAMSVLYGQLFNMPMEIYAPFLSSGIIIWSYIAMLLNEGCNTFMAVDSLIKQSRIPLILHGLRMVWRNFIILLHNLVIIIPIWIFFDKEITLENLALSSLGLLVLTLNGIWISIILGAICTRYRDITQVVGSLVQVVFFITPVMWLPSILQGKGIAEWLIVANPFYHFLDVIRAPLLGEAASMLSWYIVLTITLLGIVFSIYFFGKFKKRIPYWL